MKKVYIAALFQIYEAGIKKFSILSRNSRDGAQTKMPFEGGI